ncbi:MAG TPA: GGDEF domain-containing protein [Vicinamibacterales bacterium]|nr:GGDEF domain-containing protein [Vicinamibacterales bacterium]
MGVYAKALLIAAILVALTVSALVFGDGASMVNTPWGNVVIAAAGLLIGGLIMLAMYSMSTARQPHLLFEGDTVRPVATPPEDPGVPTPILSGDFFTDNAFLAFVEQLMAATTSERLLETIQANLPPLIGARNVWIVSELQRRSAPATTDTPEASRQPELTSDVQEWTTFPLRLQNRSMGLLGVESAGGLGAERQQAIQRVTPLLARAVNTVSAIETFREAGLVDLLTGAATRREGLNRLQSEVKRAQRTGAPMAIVMIDLDHFKSVNDRFGHAVGDALLTAIGRTLRSTLRASDIRCRWGGEEFLIILPDTDLARAQVVATHLLQNIGATYVPMPSGPVSTTASIGLTISRPGETAVNNLVTRADLALYRAKRDGRSCIRVVLGDQNGNPIGAQSDSPDPPPPRNPTVPFSDRRSPQRADRRRVPSPGRRRTDAPPSASGPLPRAEKSADARGQVLVGSR